MVLHVQHQHVVCDGFSTGWQQTWIKEFLWLQLRFDEFDCSYDKILIIKKLVKVLGTHLSHTGNSARKNVEFYVKWMQMWCHGESSLNASFILPQFSSVQQSSWCFDFKRCSTIHQHTHRGAGSAGGESSRLPGLMFFPAVCQMSTSLPARPLLQCCCAYLAGSPGRWELARTYDKVEASPDQLGKFGC